MVTYKVTTELKTPWWLKVLRFLHVKKKKEEFEITLDKDWYSKGEILRGSNCNILILGYGNMDVD